MKNSKNLEKTAWMQWNERKSCKLCKKRGIYVIAKSEKPLGDFDSICKEIIYIGETKGKGGLAKRLDDFEKCATFNAVGHSGGTDFRRKLIDDKTKAKNSWEMPEWCYVAVIAIDDDIDNDFAYKILPQYEAFLISAYYDQWGDVPLLNKEITPSLVR